MHPRVRASSAEMEQFISGLPKAELHLHLEGCVTPATFLQLAHKNGISLPYDSEQDVANVIMRSYKQAALNDNLETFFKILDEMRSVLRDKEDFSLVMYQLLEKLAQQNTRYVEIEFDPQAHTSRGIGFPVFMEGMADGMARAEAEFGIESNLIMCFHRDKSVEDAHVALKASKPYQDRILGVGLDNWPEAKYYDDFVELFEIAHREYGYLRTSHVDTEEPDNAERIWACIRNLKVDGRIDHGIGVLDDDELLDYVIEQRVALNLCPTLFFHCQPKDSQYFRDVNLAVHKLLGHGAVVTIGSDDPGVFDLRYIGDIFAGTQSHLGLSKQEVYQLAYNSFEAGWLPQSEKTRHQDVLNQYARIHGVRTHSD